MQEVKRNTKRCKHIGKDIGFSLKNLVGGEMIGYNKMLIEARKIAIERMIIDAEQLGANAIIGMRLMSSSVSTGTAVLI
nr:heavy metal-binding domain-containing protein [Clostridium perfringens]